MRLKIKTLGVILVTLILLGLVMGCGRNLTSGGGWGGGIVAEDKLYFGTPDGKIVAVDAANGAIEWIFATEDAQALKVIYSSPVYASEVSWEGDNLDFVYVNGYSQKGNDKDQYQGTIYALFANPKSRDGKVAWMHTVEGEIVSAPIIVDDLILIGTSAGHLYAMRYGEIPNGESRVIWKYPKNGAVGKIWGSPTIYKDVVYFGSMDHHVYALSLDNGRELWRFKANGAIVGRPLVLGGRVYVGSLDRNFYALDSEAGQIVWSFKGDNWFWAGPTYHEGHIYAASMGGNVYDVDPKTGSQSVLFEAEGPIVSPLTVVSGGLALSTTNKFYQVISYEGSNLWTNTVESPIFAEMIASNGIAYMILKDGSVMAISVRKSSRTTNCDRCWVLKESDIELFLETRSR